MKVRLITGLTIVFFTVSFMSCGTQKQAVNNAPTINVATADTAQTLSVRELTFAQKVSDNRVYATNITSDLSFTLNMGGENVTVPGSLHMRKDQVIRIQLFVPILGSEVGRLELTPDSVLIVDRIHKEYIKEGYNQLDFLRDNGLNFYGLQSLFWNQLMLPGKQTVYEEDLKEFSVDFNSPGATLPLTYNKARMGFVWHANKATGLISEASVTYSFEGKNTSTLNWYYSNFQPVGVKQFPAKQSFMFTTTATKQKQMVSVTLDMDKVQTDSGWDVKSTVSNKYKKVNAQDVFSKLLSM